MAKNALLEVQELSVGYGGDPVCAPVSVSVQAGTALGVIGPNGAGKSTVLQTLVGLLPAIAGSVRFDGREVDEREAGFRRDVATVLDDDAFFPSLTGAEHLLLTARGHGVTAPDAVVEAEIEEFGLGDRAHALPSALSSGQRRRLALAAAFVRPAKLLVLDEPERRLDAQMRRQLAARIAADVAGGLTVVFASHDAEFLSTVARRVLVVDDHACSVVSPKAAVAALHEG